MPQTDEEKSPYWILRNAKICTIVGIIIILIGQVIYFLYQQTHLNYLSVISHFLTILGEAVFVMFLLHILVEKRNHNYSHSLLQKQSEHFKIEFQGLINSFKEDANTTIENMKEGIFAALLKDKMPHKFVEAIIENKFFDTEILRKNLVLSFEYQKTEKNTLYLHQRTDFDIEYVSGKSSHYEYDMGVNLSDTPLVKYKLLEAGCKKCKSKDPVRKFSITDEIVQDPSSPDKLLLKELIQIKKGEEMSFYQIIEAQYQIGNGGAVDNYFTNLHTLKMNIEINRFPEEYVFDVYPTFPSENFNKPEKTGTKISYRNIEFLVPGQGFGFSISKK